jgi:hypothetical protein
MNEILFLTWLVLEMGVMVYLMITALTAKTEQDIAAAKRVAIGAIVAGILMFLSKPLAVWFYSGGDLNAVQNPDQYISNTLAKSVPTQVVTSVNLIMSLLQYLGIAVIIIGMIYAGIRWVTAE